MIIAHNLWAMNAQRQYNIVTNRKAKTSEKLSSGYKINRAADDAAGLAISEKMRRQIRGLTQGVENTQDGVSLCQVADGALSEVNDMLHRITELSIKSANGTNSEQDRQYIQEEINQILQEIERIGNTTTFNEQKIFKGNRTQAITPPTTSVTPSVGEIIPPTVTNVTRTLSVEISGTPTASRADAYDISADLINGIIIDGTTYDWSEVKTADGKTLADNDLSAGSYSLTHSGITLAIGVSEYQTLENIVDKLNGGLSIPVSERINTQAKAVSTITMTSGYLGRVTNSTPTKPLEMPEYRIYADDNGLRINSNTVVSWASMGLDIDNPTAGVYSFSDPDTSLAFEFKVENEATKDAIINGLNNVKINVRAGDKYFYAATTEGRNSTDTCHLSLFNKLNDPMDNYPLIYNDGDMIPGMGTLYATYAAYFRLGKDDSGNPKLAYIGDQMVGGTRDSRHDFYMTNESLNRLRNWNYSLPVDEDTSMNRFEFKNSNGSRIYMYLENDGSGNYDEVLEDFSTGYIIGFGCMKYDTDLTATGALTNTQSEGNVGKTTYTTFIDPTNQILLNNQEEIEITTTSPAPSDPPTPSDKPAIKEGILSLWIQSGCEAGDGMWLEIDNMNTSILGIDDLDVSTIDGANHAMDAVKGALQKITANRSKIGAQQNRLEHTIANEENVIENTTAAESRIRDTDMAKEMVGFSNINILEQVGHAMMAQANQSNQGVLNLLQ